MLGEGGEVGLSERIRTDPASVTHEGDWGFLAWSGAVVLVLLAITLVILGCCAAIWTSQWARSFDSVDWGYGWWGTWGPPILLIVLAVTTAASCVGGPVLLASKVHGIARHTASTGLSFTLIIGVYIVAYVALWKVGEWVATGFGVDRFDYGEERLWRRILRGAAVVFVVLAFGNVVMESLNLISAASGIAISTLLAFLAMAAMFLVASALSR
ncbi:hypothetical protein G6031_01900 [Dietzia sp. CQ4]|uniref:hypothetical protein n=1 Tax=Dietzia sp. (strain CQ4) TaxID=370437 RepID=UPI0015F8B545|nr:hypothetical protein [Dietzia sp. CQ4]MBB1033146.1 hypothetical protein [Dietzia sp. CQ4]